MTRPVASDEIAASVQIHATMLDTISEDFGLDEEGLFEEVHRVGHLSSMVGFIYESFLASEHGLGRATKSS